MRPDTVAIHAGISADPTTGAIIPPLYQTATYALEEVGKNKGYDYTRCSNPTRETLENNLAAIEGAAYGVSFASGLSAVDSVLRLLSAGDHVICSDDVYGGVTRLFEQVLKRFGLTFSYVDTSNPEEIFAALQPNTRLLWIETPTNPLLKITDLSVIREIKKRQQLIVGVDSTFATPLLLRPLDWGADVVVHSTTKYISGHNQLIGGICLVNDRALFDDLKLIQRTLGAVSAPFDCWLTLLGVKTLSVRVARHCENAERIALFLAKHERVERVIYPGLPNHPQHQIARQQMKAFGGMISFELRGGLEAGKTLMNSLKLASLAESLGAVETMITHPASMTHASVPRETRLARGLTDGLVRLSVGIEDVLDIKEDLAQALEAIA